MSEEIILGILTGAVIAVWVYAITLASYLITTSDWFIRTWIGKAMNEAWNLIRETIQAILPPYKR